jgi:hypothetical protein
VADFDDFKNCCLTEGQLDVDALKFVFNEFKDLIHWWENVDLPTKLFTQLALKQANRHFPVSKIVEFFKRALRIEAALVEEAIITIVGWLAALALSTALFAAMAIAVTCLRRLEGRH